MWNGKTSIYKVQAILLVQGPGVETADVSRRMGVAGRMIKTSEGKPGWAYFTSDGVDGLQPLDLHLTSLFELIRKKKAAFRRLRARFSVEVIAEFLSESDYAGFELSRATLAELGRLRLDLRFSGSCFLISNAMHDGKIPAGQ